MKYEIPHGHLSASAIGTLLKCPKQYEFRYVKGIIIPPGKALATGSIFHKTLEMYYEDAMASRERLTPPQAGELSMSVIPSHARNAAILNRCFVTSYPHMLS